MNADRLPPELCGNYCHIAPEWLDREGQKIWFVGAPYGGDVLRFNGEPTSLLYAIAPLVHVIKARAPDSCLSELSLADVALLNPPVASEPLYDELAQRLSRQSLRLLCISALTASSEEARRIARLAKSINPNTIVVFGGPHEGQIEYKTAVDPLFRDDVDFSVSGDGEYALLRLAEIVWRCGGADPEAVKEEVRRRKEEFVECPGWGSLWFTLAGRSQQLSFSNQRIDLDRLPRMPRELLCEADTRTFSVFKNRGWNVKTAQVMTHRGCSWHCNFCTEAIRLNRRSLESVIEEVDEILSFGQSPVTADFGVERVQLVRKPYEAIFFDDSTFTTRSGSRREYLARLFDHLSSKGVEWGCQTRLDQIDEPILREMKRGGCTYVFVGMESINDDMLWSMQKGLSREEVEKAFDIVNSVGIRLGVSLVFGAPHENSATTIETPASIRETVEFLRAQAERGNITLISPNVATYYPGSQITQELLKAVVARSLSPRPGGAEPAVTNGVAVADAYEKVSFRQPFVNRGYPWNRFEEGEGLHAWNFGSKQAELVLRECIEQVGEYLVSQDLFAVDEYQEACRKGHLDAAGLRYVYLNHASIAKPLADARRAAEEVAGSTKTSERQSVIRRAGRTRKLLTGPLGIPASEAWRIVLARNATEATGLVAWLAGLYERESPKVLTTTAENLSIPRAFRFQMDLSNPDGQDPWCSFQDFGVVARRRGNGKTRLETRVEVVDVHRLDAAPEDAILAAVDESVALVVFSHVLRDSGTILDVPRVCAGIREKSPKALIVVDGAQAFGALPPYRLGSLGCDFYVAAPHKTLGSLPVGVLYYAGSAGLGAAFRGLAGAGPQPALLHGMVDPRAGLDALCQGLLSEPELASLEAALKSLSEHFGDGKDFLNALDRHRGDLKRLCTNELREHYPGIEIVSPVGPRHSNFILGFRFPGADNRLLVEYLWRRHLVFASYIARSDLIRLSFGAESTEDDIRAAIMAINVSAPSCTKRAATYRGSDY